MIKKTMLISGGQGDLAQAVAQRYKNEYEVYVPSSKEMDVTSKGSVITYINERKIDVLINNAGTIHPQNILESNEELWERDIKVNLIGPYLVSKTVLQINSSALIINVSSTAAYNYYSNWSSYCSSKAGLVSFTKCLAAQEFNVYCLCPGAIETKFRNGLGLPNTHAMSKEQFVEQVDNVLKQKYTKGDAIFFRKNELIVNPKFN